MSAACCACRGQCCYNALIRVTGDDIRRIRVAQALDTASFVTAVPDIGRAKDALAVSFALGDPPQPHLLALRHSSRVAGACAFLLLLGNQQPCGIYAQRPMVCRVYPMHAASGGIAVREDVICRPADWDPASLDAAAWLTAIGQRDAEWQTYARVAAVWNETRAPGRSGEAADYFSFLEATYEDIASRRADQRSHGPIPDAAIDESARRALSVAV